MSYFDLTTWRVQSAQELINNLDRKSTARKNHKGKKRKSKKNGGLLVFRKLLSPLDVYSYLKARFGEPNGTQSMMIHKIGMVRDDSSNLFHWDYALMAGERLLTFTGAAREVHVMVEENFTDEEWCRFASCLKEDFGNYGKQKAAIVTSLQKWHIFPNRFNSIAARCAELQDDLDSAVKSMRGALPERPKIRQKRHLESWGKQRSELTTKLTSSSVQLSVLTPVMFESFIGLITAVMLKQDVRNSKRLFENFKRSHLDIKIFELANKCSGFRKPIKETNAILKAYWKVVNERNDIIHGNVDPIKDALEIVYFEGNKPIFPTGGDSIQSYFDSLIAQYRPEKVLANYLLAHELIIEILDHMTPSSKASIISLMSDTQPGWDEDRQRIGMLFPDYVGHLEFEGLRYDTDLRAKVELPVNIAPAD